jgi:hypothetical protein
MVLRITGVLDFIHRPVFCKTPQDTFRKLDLFPSNEGEGDHTLLGPLERANLSCPVIEVSSF